MVIPWLTQWKEVLAGIAMLVGGKLAVMAAIGPMFGLTQLSAIRAGLLIAPGMVWGTKSVSYEDLWIGILYKSYRRS